MSVDIVATDRAVMTSEAVIPTTLSLLNSTLNSTNGSSVLPTSSPAPKHEPMASLVIRLILIGFIFLATVSGNALTIYVIKQNRALRSIKNYYYGYYLMNLSVSDLLVGVICIPFTVIYYMTSKWPFGSFFCKLMPTMQVMSVSASISTLTYITFERYQAIVNPLKPRSSLLSLKITIAVIWLWSLIVGIPSFISYQYNDKLPDFQCREVWGNHLYRQVYTAVLFTVNYGLPLVLIFLAYARILHELKGRSSDNMIDSNQTRILHRRFVTLMLILVTSFAVCYLPSNVMFFVLDFDSAKDEYTFGIILNYAHVLVWLSSCLNPFVYGILDSYFKRGFKKAIGISSNSEKTECFPVVEDKAKEQGYLGVGNGSSPWSADTGTSQLDFDAMFQDYKTNKGDLYSDYPICKPASNGPITADYSSAGQTVEATEAVEHEEPVSGFPYYNTTPCLQTEDSPEDSKEIFISLDYNSKSGRPDLIQQGSIITHEKPSVESSNDNIHCVSDLDLPSRNEPIQYKPLSEEINDLHLLNNNSITVNRYSGFRNKIVSTDSESTPPSPDLEDETASERGFVSLILYHDKDKRELNSKVGDTKKPRREKGSSWYDCLLSQSSEELSRLIDQLSETTL